MGGQRGGVSGWFSLAPIHSEREKPCILPFFLIIGRVNEIRSMCVWLDVQDMHGNSPSQYTNSAQWFTTILAPGKTRSCRPLCSNTGCERARPRCSSSSGHRRPAVISGCHSRASENTSVHDYTYACIFVTHLHAFNLGALTGRVCLRRD